MAGLNEGTTVLAEDRYGEPYCGSERAIAYRTIQNQRKGANVYGSFEYRFSDRLSWFADVQLGRQEVKLLTGTNGNDVASDHMGWEFHDPDSTNNYRNKMFYNATTGHYEIWSRQFTPEEIGGLQNRMNVTTEKTFAVTTGLKGYFGEDWDWEASYNHSQYNADVGMPRIKADAANQLFLGNRLGYDDDGYAIYAPDPARLFTPLTTAEFASIAAMSTFRPKSDNDNLSLTFNTPSLFAMPAGDVGFAGAIEWGTQSYRINPDPLALTEDAYVGPRYGDGSGSRDHWSAAGELRMPLLSTLQASLAGRYDRYSYGSKNPGKFTYSMGLEWRPLDSLLVRGSYGTGFRAPDMHYLFAGADYYRTRYATDYYQCRTAEPGATDDYCYDDGSYDVSTFDVYRGNMELDVETSKSFTAGLVWSPSANFDIAVDYYDIRVMNQVQTQDRELLRVTEANCRLGMTDTGTPVDANSATCIDARWPASSATAMATSPACTSRPSILRGNKPRVSTSPPTIACKQHALAISASPATTTGRDDTVASNTRATRRKTCWTSASATPPCRAPSPTLASAGTGTHGAPACSAPTSAASPTTTTMPGRRPPGASTPACAMT